jgi:hypothetical protein
LNWTNNKRIYRIAEAYLNAAELELAVGNGQGAAQPYLDAIRERAYGRPNSIPATLENIKLERRKEFFGEGLRFWQLLRWGQDEQGRPLSDVLGNSPTFSFTFTNADGDEVTTTVVQQRTWNVRSRLLPIPQGNIDQAAGGEHELRQNPGY